MAKLIDEIGQFATIPHSVIKLWPLIGTDAIGLFVYLRYRTHRRRRVAFPSYDTIYKETKMNRHKISKSIKVLEAFRILERHKRFGKSTEYALKLPNHQ